MKFFIFYIIGLCAERAQIKPKNYHLFNYLSYKDLCEFRGMIAIHKIKPSDMKKAYDFTINPNNTCAGPGKRVKIRKVKTFTRSCE